MSDPIQPSSPETKTNVAVDFRTRISDAVKGANELAQKKVIDVFVERDVQKRADALVLVVEQWDKLRKELQGIKADVIQYDENRKQIGEGTWTKPQLDKKQKVVEQLGKLEKALNKALENNDYGDVFQLAKSGGKPTPEDTSSKAE